MNQFRPVTMIARTTPGTHNPRISAQTVTNRLQEIGERPPYTMYVLYAAFLFWPSIFYWSTRFALDSVDFKAHNCEARIDFEGLHHHSETNKSI